MTCMQQHFSIKEQAASFQQFGNMHRRITHKQAFFYRQLMVSMRHLMIQFILNNQQQKRLIFKMIEEKALSAKCFLKSNEMRQRYECGICFEVCMKPVKCRGSCNRIYCMKCVSDTRLVLDKCPYRCSQPFLVTILPQLELQFYCPYNPSLCIHHIKSLKQFEQHYKICQYVPKEELHAKKMKQQYKCQQNHHLQFYIGTYQQMLKLYCNSCQQQKLCRSFCRSCQQHYCVTCRVPPCSKQGCPLGHQFNFQRIANLNYICDICGISTAVSNNGVYDDNHCNFGICQTCYSHLPQKFDQSRPREIIANINTQCSCTHTLVYINSQHIISCCQLCNRYKQCPKWCNNCQKSYCIDCKIMDIYPDDKCCFGHQQQKVNLEGNQSLLQNQANFGCMKCGKVHNQYYYDQQCHTRLCETCYNYCIKISTEKQCPILLKCNKNHILSYIGRGQDYYLDCSLCNKQKIIKLACNFCGQDQRFYCFECRPIVLQTCYYHHQLVMQHLVQAKACHYCMREENDVYFCRKCLFYVCVSCQEAHSQQGNIQCQEEVEGNNMEQI